MSKESTTWRSYEEVAAYLLDEMAAEFELEWFEGKQKLAGTRSDRIWEIDAKGVGHNADIFVIVECRRYTTSKQNQEKVAALAYRILDTGAVGGIVVSHMGLQKGAAILARAENIHSVILDANSTTTDYVLKFLEKTRYGVSLQLHTSRAVTVSAQVTRKDGTIEDDGEL